MLKKENRLKKRQEFLEVKNEGVLIHSPFFGFVGKKYTDNVKKFGFIISKKISKKAVDRNKIKRLLADSVKSHLNILDYGWKGIFLVKKSILKQKMETIEQEVEKMFNQLK